MRQQGGIQLPDDVASCGYRQTRPFRFEQIFSSKSANFTGTEQEFVAAGLAYQFLQVEPHTRLVVKE